MANMIKCHKCQGEITEGQKPLGFFPESLIPADHITVGGKHYHKSCYQSMISSGMTEFQSDLIKNPKIEIHTDLRSSTLFKLVKSLENSEDSELRYVRNILAKTLADNNAMFLGCAYCKTMHYRWEMIEGKKTTALQNKLQALHPHHGKNGMPRSVKLFCDDKCDAALTSKAKLAGNNAKLAAQSEVEALKTHITKLQNEQIARTSEVTYLRKTKDAILNSPADVDYPSVLTHIFINHAQLEATENAMDVVNMAFESDMDTDTKDKLSRIVQYLGNQYIEYLLAAITAALTSAENAHRDATEEINALIAKANEIEKNWPKTIIDIVAKYIS